MILKFSISSFALIFKFDEISIFTLFNFLDFGFLVAFDCQLFIDICFSCFEFLIFDLLSC